MWYLTTVQCYFSCEMCVTAEHKTPIWTMYMYVGLCDVQYFAVTTLL